MVFTRFLRRVLASACLLGFTLGFAPFARAQGADSPAPQDMLVVEVDESAPAVDPVALRAALRRDLHVEAVPPGDPRAAQARGAVHVAYDGRTLVVSYRARPEVLTRRIEVPPNAAAVERAAVILAGNLARDEGSELAANLRAQHPGTAGADAAANSEAPAPPVPSRATRERTNAARSTGESDASGPTEVERLQRTLDYLADQDHRTKLALAWSFLGVGAAATGGGAVVLNANNSNTAGLVLAIGGGGLVLSGALTFFASSPFDTLADYNREHASAEWTEATWERLAHSEHSRRRLGGVLALVSAGISAGLATYGIASSPSSATGYGDWVALFAGLEAVTGVYLLVTDGPVESALHSYEGTAGKVLWKDGALGHLRVGMVPGGATAGFGATF
jgi:hypothetical protein